jgi:uncharacterized protein YdiU (UPF0061 family)
VRLAHALFPLIGDVGAVEAALGAYGDTLTRARSRTLAEKLGLLTFREDETRADGTPCVSDTMLVDDLFEILAAVETDFTLFFRHLADVTTDPAAGEASDEALLAPLRDAYYDPSGVSEHDRSRLLVWLRRYVARVRDDGRPDAERRRAMNAVNPKYVLRNYVAQLAIQAAEQSDLSVLGELLDVLRRPFDEQPAHARFAEKRPDWARNRPGCSMLSCSS